MALPCLTERIILARNLPCAVKLCLLCKIFPHLFLRATILNLYVRDKAGVFAALCLAALLYPGPIHAAQRPLGEDVRSVQKKMDLTFKTGIDYSQGHYCTAELYRDWETFFKLSLSDERLYLSSEVSWVKTTASDGYRAEGWSDLSLEMSYTFDLKHDFFLDLDTELMLPTADTDNGIGVGVFGYFLGTTLTYKKDWGYISASLGLDVDGDKVEPVFPGTPSVSLDAGLEVADGVYLGAAYDWERVRHDSPVSEVTGYIDADLSDDFSLYLYLLKGLADNSPDYGTGLTVTYRF